MVLPWNGNAKHGHNKRDVGVDPSSLTSMQTSRKHGSKCCEYDDSVCDF